MLRATPHVVLIVADDMGYSDLGCYGGEIATPTLDRLGRAGARLSHFYNTTRMSTCMLVTSAPWRLTVFSPTSDL
jgi:arylsulfatase A-like enzyme